MRLSKRFLATILIIVAILVTIPVLPTILNQWSVETRVLSLDCNQVIDTGQNVTTIYSPVTGITKFAIHVASDMDLTVVLTSYRTKQDFESNKPVTLYLGVGMYHLVNLTSSSYGYQIMLVKHPMDNMSANVWGRIDVYRISNPTFIH